MEKNNPNKTFRAIHKAANLATIMQKGAIRGQALVLRCPYTTLISTSLGRRITLNKLTYAQAGVVIAYGESHIKRREGGG